MERPVVKTDKLVYTDAPKTQKNISLNVSGGLLPALSHAHIYTLKCIVWYL